MYNQSIVKGEINTRKNQSLLNAGLDYWVLVLSLFLTMAHVPFSYIPQLVIRFICLLILLFFAIRGGIKLAKKETELVVINRIFVGLLILFILIESVAHLRAAYSYIVSPEIAFWNWISWICLTLFTFVVFLRKRDNSDSFEYRSAVCYTLIAYIVANCLLQVIGFEPPYPFTKTFPAMFLAKLGIITSRTLFPTSVGFNSSGIMGGAAFLAGLLFLMQGRNRIEKGFGLAGLLTGIYVIVLTDCRGALVFAIAAGLVMLIPFTRTFPVLKWLAPISLLIPIGLIQIMRYCQGPAWLSFSHSTSGAGANSLLSGRMVIWTAFTDFFSDFHPMHLIGYGFDGQLISHISRLYSNLFLPWALPETISAHNFPLQLTIEIGYVGLLLTLILISMTLFNLGKFSLENNDLPAKILFFILIYFLLMGSTESVLTLGHPETQYMLMLIFTCSMAITRRPRTDDNPAYLLNPDGMELKTPENSTTDNYSKETGYAPLESVVEAKMRAVVKAIYEVARRYMDFKKGGRILVAGAGSGIEAILVHEVFQMETAGVDLNISSKNWQDDHPTVNLFIQDISKLGFAEKSFSFVYSYHVLEHVTDPVTTLHEFFRVMQPGSVLFIGFPNKHRLVSYIGTSNNESILMKVKWNLNDLKYRLAGKFENYFGAHAGFTEKEFIQMASDTFHLVIPVRDKYMVAKYPRLRRLLLFATHIGFSEFLFPSNYFICIKGDH